MKYTLVILSALFIAGCSHTASPKIDAKQLVVIDVPSSFLNCPLPPKPPRSETLTNKEVAAYIDTLYKRLVECNINMEKVKTFIEKTKKDLERKR